MCACRTVYCTCAPVYRCGCEASREQWSAAKCGTDCALRSPNTQGIDWSPSGTRHFQELVCKKYSLVLCPIVMNLVSIAINRSMSCLQHGSLTGKASKGGETEASGLCLQNTYVRRLGLFGRSAALKIAVYFVVAGEVAAFRTLEGFAGNAVIDVMPVHISDIFPARRG